MELAKNHITLTSTQDMLNLSSPLKILNVDFFSYTRYYFDGTSISLLTHTDWYQFFLKAEVPGCINVFNLKTGCNLWAELFPEKAVYDAKIHFNIDNGIHFAYREKDYVEAISFASNYKNTNAIGCFIANIDLLEKFNVYFRNHASKLINEALKNKIVIPQIMRGYEVIESGFALSFEDRRKFLSTIGYDVLNNLSKREFECLKYISRGMTTKESAKIMAISPRTVEVHISKMKEKLNCPSKSQLAEIYWTKFNNN